MSSALTKLLMLLAMAVASAPAPAMGEETEPLAGRVVIVTMGGCCPGQSWAEAEAAAQAELTAMGLEVVLRPSQTPDDRQGRLEMSRLAEEHEAACAIRIVRSPEAGGAELWVEDRVTGKTLFRIVELQSFDGRAAASIAALRTIETLRASLIELRLDQSVRPRTDIPGAIEDLVEEALPEIERAPGRFAFWFGPSASGTPRGVGPLLSLTLTVRLNVLSFLALEMDAAASVWTREVEGGGMGSSFDTFVARLFLLWTPAPLLRRIRLGFGVGAGAVVAWTAGVPAPGVLTEREATAVAAFGGRASLSLALTPFLELRFDVTVSGLVPEVQVLHDGQVASVFGPTMLEGFLGLGFRLPR